MSSFNPTTKTQEALQAALQLASAKGNPDIRPAHLLVAVLEQPDGIAIPVLRAAGVRSASWSPQRPGELVESYPQRAAAKEWQPRNFNRDALNVFTKAQELAGELGDDYVSTEVVLAAIAPRAMMPPSCSTPAALAMMPSKGRFRPCAAQRGSLRRTRRTNSRRWRNTPPT